MGDFIRHGDGRTKSLGDRAADDLRVIRETIEGATAFTALSGFGAIVIGVTAVGTALVASGQTDEGKWLALWLVEAMLATCIGVYAIRRKARVASIPLHTPAIRNLALSFAPPIIAGALLTVVLHRDGFTGLLPGTWLLLYGAGIVSGGRGPNA